MLIYAIAQITIMDLVALGCIRWHSAVYQGTRQSKTCGGNSKTCQDDNIAVLYMNIVFIFCRKTMLIYAIPQMAIIDLVALGYIPWHSVVYQGTRLHSQGLNFDSDRLSMEGHMSRQIGQAE
jgi:hypothetical protein